MGELIEEKIKHVKVTFETCCISSLQLDALNDILQLLFLDAGLNNEETIAKVLEMMDFHKINHLVLECRPFSYYLKVDKGVI